MHTDEPSAVYTIESSANTDSMYTDAQKVIVLNLTKSETSDFPSACASNHWPRPPKDSERQCES